MREPGTYITEEKVTFEGVEYTKKTTEKIGRDDVCLNYVNEFNPPIKFPMTWEKMK